MKSVGEREGKGSEGGGDVSLPPAQSESLDGSSGNQDIVTSTSLETVELCDDASLSLDAATAGTPQDSTSSQDTTTTTPEITPELSNTTTESQDTSILPSDTTHDAAKTSLSSETFSASEVQAGITMETDTAGQLPAEAQRQTEGERKELGEETESALEGGSKHEQEERPKESVLGK